MYEPLPSLLRAPLCLWAWAFWACPAASPPLVEAFGSGGCALRPTPLSHAPPLHATHPLTHITPHSLFTPPTNTTVISFLSFPAFCFSLVLCRSDVLLGLPLSTPSSSLVLCSLPLHPLPFPPPPSSRRGCRLSSFLFLWQTSSNVPLVRLSPHLPQLSCMSCVSTVSPCLTPIYCSAFFLGVFGLLSAHSDQD